MTLEQADKDQIFTGDQNALNRIADKYNIDQQMLLEYARIAETARQADQGDATTRFGIEQNVDVEIKRLVQNDDQFAKTLEQNATFQQAEVTLQEKGPFSGRWPSSSKMPAEQMRRATSEPIEADTPTR